MELVLVAEIGSKIKILLRQLLTPSASSGATLSVSSCAVAGADTGADERVSIQLTETADGCVSVPRSECTSTCCCATLKHTQQALRPSFWEHLHKS